MAPDLVCSIANSTSSSSSKLAGKEKGLARMYLKLYGFIRNYVSCISFIIGLGFFNVFDLCNRNQQILPFCVRLIFQHQMSPQFSLARGNSIICRCCDRIIICMFGTSFNSVIPLRIRGIFSTDSFVVNWDISLSRATSIALFFICGNLDSRRSFPKSNSKIVRETL